MTASFDSRTADAIRLAASEIQPRKNVKVEIECEPLAETLCNHPNFDAHELELLIRACTGKLRKIKQPANESATAHAIRRAGAAWGPKPQTETATEGAVRRARAAWAAWADEEPRPSLAEILSQPDALGAGEYELLAFMFMGKMRLTDGESRPKVGAGSGKHATVMEALQARMNEGTPHKAAVYDTAKEFCISFRLVEKYEAMGREADAENAAARAPYEQCSGQYIRCIVPKNA